MASVAVYSLKGGVGKSTIAVNLAHQSATVSGRRTLLWDIDAQGASGFLLQKQYPGAQAHRIFSRDVKPADMAMRTAWPQLHLLAADVSLRQLDVQLAETDARKRLRKLLRELTGNFERIILDCPPGLTETSEQIFRAVDMIVIPVVPSPLALRAYEEVAAHILRHRRNPPLLVPVLSMVDRRRHLHREMVEEHPDWPVIPASSLIERMTVEQAPIGSFAPSHPAAKAFGQLWAGVERKLIGRAQRRGRPEKDD